jgi:hypothetical protein
MFARNVEADGNCSRYDQATPPVTFVSRRKFFKLAAAGAGAAAMLPAAVIQLHANPLGMPIGCQTWPVREMITKDFPGTVKELATAGFQAIELCSPGGYADSGFASLAKYRGSELRRILADAGVACVSSHFTITELRTDQEDRINWVSPLQISMTISSRRVGYLFSTSPLSLRTTTVSECRTPPQSGS